MEYNRESAKQNISSRSQNDTDLNYDVEVGQNKEIELTKIKNQHEMDTLKADRGWVGVLFGSWKNVPMFVALI